MTKTCALCMCDPEEAIKIIKQCKTFDQKHYITCFIYWLEEDLAMMQARDSTKRTDIHRWMIKYLERELQKL